MGADLGGKVEAGLPRMIHKTPGVIAETSGTRECGGGGNIFSHWGINSCGYTPRLRKPKLSSPMVMSFFLIGDWYYMASVGNFSLGRAKKGK
ncbi:MAG: hypothetical protein CM15mP82_0010 [Methanobacteriota archaeon]|nr:MAG: hypothetical protein CM15mP82_0010 [Euryarchaeota archaeon]